MATDYATVRLGSVDSTQDEARRHFGEQGRPVLVVAERQVGGRGRSGRQWEQAPRAMFSSLAVRPGWPSPTWPRLALCTGVAVSRALAAVLDVRTDLKWPNDLVTPGGKLGGILVEARDGVVVIGCGVNLWWPAGPTPPPEGAAGALPDDPGPDAAGAVAAVWAEHLLGILGGDPAGWPLQAYRERCVTLGRLIEWEPEGTGTAVDVADDGGLVVDTPHGVEVLYAGEVRSVRPA